MQIDENNFILTLNTSQYLEEVKLIISHIMDFGTDFCLYFIGI